MILCTLKRTNMVVQTLAHQTIIQAHLRMMEVVNMMTTHPPLLMMNIIQLPLPRQALEPVETEHVISQQSDVVVQLTAVMEVQYVEKRRVWPTNIVVMQKLSMIKHNDNAEHKIMPDHRTLVSGMIISVAIQNHRLLPRQLVELLAPQLNAFVKFHEHHCILTRCPIWVRQQK